VRVFKRYYISCNKSKTKTKTKTKTKVEKNMEYSFLFIVFIMICDNCYGEVIMKSRNNLNELMKDAEHGIKMGIIFDGCDDGRNDLDIDWNESPLNYTCYHPKNPLPIMTEVDSIEECDDIPDGYIPQHHCMGYKIEYNTSLPTFGDHRPLWPMFGEYKFVPPQRWLHNIEHGAIVMLYHPCTHPIMVNRLRAIVTNCLRKHVITRYNLIDKQRPLALIAWGCRLRMNYVDTNTVISFIKRKSMKGREGRLSKEGQYSKHLLRLAKPALGSNYEDSVICPNM